MSKTSERASKRSFWGDDVFDILGRVQISTLDQRRYLCLKLASYVVHRRCTRSFLLSRSAITHFCRASDPVESLLLSVGFREIKVGIWLFWGSRILAAKSFIASLHNAFWIKFKGKNFPHRWQFSPEKSFFPSQRSVLYFFFTFAIRYWLQWSVWRPKQKEGKETAKWRTFFQQCVCVNNIFAFLRPFLFLLIAFLMTAEGKKSFIFSRCFAKTSFYWFSPSIAFEVKILFNDIFSSFSLCH